MKSHKYIHTLHILGHPNVAWGGGGGGFQVSTVSNLNPSCIELELGLGFDNYFFRANFLKQRFQGPYDQKLTLFPTKIYTVASDYCVRIMMYSFQSQHRLANR